MGGSSAWDAFIAESKFLQGGMEPSYTKDKQSVRER